MRYINIFCQKNKRDIAIVALLLRNDKKPIANSQWLKAQKIIFESCGIVGKFFYFCIQLRYHGIEWQRMACVRLRSLNGN